MKSAMPFLGVTAPRLKAILRPLLTDPAYRGSVRERAGSGHVGRSLRPSVGRYPRDQAGHACVVGAASGGRAPERAAAQHDSCTHRQDEHGGEP